MVAKRFLASVLGLSIFAAVLPAMPANAAAGFSIDAGRLRIALSDTGVVTSLTDKVTAREYSSADHRRSLIQIVANGAQQVPTGLTHDAATGVYDFTFGGVGAHVKVKAQLKSAYTTFEVTELTAPANVDVSVMMWGPVTTSITKTVGEAAGVVYDSDFTIGIKQLNDKTVGGWVEEYNGLTYEDPTYTTPMPFVKESASRTKWGSILQSYTYDHSVPRVRHASVGGLRMPNQPHDALPGTAGKIVGSKIALFGAATPTALDTISAVQTGEGLIHPMVDGVWDKKSQASGQSFLVLSDLNTTNVAQASQYANAAGIKYVYGLYGAGGPWVHNGHFKFDSRFGSSDTAAAQLVATAATYGVKVGVHTLSNFIDPGDAYTTPTPHAGLVKGGYATLTRPLDATGTDIYVTVDAPFRNALFKYIQIGAEIASYNTITQISSTEWKLSGGTRKIWSTTAASYATGTTVARLVGNQYGGVVGGLPIIDEIATRLSTIWNTTGIKAMSFDGMETASQAGYGTYGTNRMVNGMYRQMTSTDDFISEASNLTPGTWDAQTRISWGEEGPTPWTQRYYNNSYAQRNLLPGMLGWSHLQNSVLDTEYKLSKMASWNAGVGFQTSVGAINSLSQRAEILGAIKLWEQVRNAGAFTKGQRARLKDLRTYWHLTVVTAGSRWNLQQLAADGTAIGSPEAVFVGNTDPAGEVNLAGSATPTSSTEYDGRYLVGNAIDDLAQQDGFSEWAAKGESNPWLRLDWTGAKQVGRVTLYDRPNLGDWAKGGTLSFSDGTSVEVTGIPNDGTPHTITFPARSVSWMTFQVKGGSGPNVGLSEIKVFAEPNLARSATASASSTYDSRFAAAKAVDGVTGQHEMGEWASRGEVNPWLRLDWSEAKTVNRVTLFDRPNSTDWAKGGTLSFSDGTSVPVSGIPNDGSAYSVTFPSRSATWVRFQVSGGAGSNVGLSELQVFAAENLAASATATASTEYDGRYVPGNALDGSVDTEWASLAEVNPWLRLAWPSAKPVGGVVFRDRPNSTDWAKGGTLSFSDGTSVPVSGIPNDGSAYSVTFPSRSVTWVRFQVAGGAGSNVGLAEFQPY